MSEKPSSLHYINYLALDKILGAQHLVSKEKGEEAHEEMLFIIIHQTYELWFKQILHELGSALKLFRLIKLTKAILDCCKRMDRINKIMTTLIGSGRCFRDNDSFRFFGLSQSSFLAFDFNHTSLEN